MPSRKATWNGYAILFLLPVSLACSFFLPYGLITAPIFLLIIIHQLILREIFKGPKRRSPVFSDPEWELINLRNKGFDVYGFINWQP